MTFDKLIIERSLLFSVDKNRVYRRLGYKKTTTQVNESMLRRVKTLLSDAAEMVDPCGTYIIRKIKKRENRRISFQKSRVTLEGQSIQNLLKEAFGAVFMAVTIGAALEERIAEETKGGNIDQAVVLDAFGSEAVEAAADSLNTFLVSQARQMRYFLSTRFSPGYGDLALSHQKSLHKELALQDLGISITEKNLLLPEKTITAVIGVER